jgi:Tfp pilus assembly protein PilF
MAHNTVARRAFGRDLTWSALAVIVATLIAYAPALRGPQIFDDTDAIEANPSIRTLRPLSVPLHPPSDSPVAGRPTANLTLAVNFAINEQLGIDQQPGSKDPNRTVGYHVFNLLIHLATGALIFGVIRRTIANGRFATSWQDAAGPIALVTSALWLVHPIQTEAVNYLVQRTEQLVSLCYVGTLYCSIRAWDAASGRARASWSVAAAVVCLLGMGSKEVMISAPAMIVLYDRAFRLETWRELRSPRLRWRFWLYGALFACAAALVAQVANAPRGKSVGFDIGVKWHEYLYSQGWAIPHYLRLVLWPDQLTIDYGRKPVEDVMAIPGLIALTAAGIGTLVAWRNPNRWGWIGFLGAWFFLLLAPSSSFVPIATEIAAERRVYLALAALLVLAVVGAESVRRRLVASDGGRTRALVRHPEWIAGAVVAVLGLATFARSRIYSDPEAIWRDAIAKRPENARAYNNLGVELVRQVPPRVSEGQEMFRKATALDSTYTDALYNLGASAIALHRDDEAERLLRRTIALDSTYASALANLGKMLFERGQVAEAIPYLERAARYHPTDQTFVDLARAYMVAGQPGQAIATFRRALDLDPSRTDVMSYLGALLTEQGNPETAVPLLEGAVMRDPSSGVNLALLSLAYAETRRGEEAARAASGAVARGGTDPRVYLFAGRAALTIGRAAEAEQYLIRAVALSPADPDALTALGIAKVALGKRTDGVELFRRALVAKPDYAPARTALTRLEAAGR